MVCLLYSYNNSITPKLVLMPIVTSTSLIIVSDSPEEESGVIVTV